MTEEQLKEKHQAMVDCWRLLRVYHQSQLTDEYWQRLITSAHQIYNKYQESEFVKDQLVAVIMELKRQSDTTL